jgi:hypothetical protein
MDIVVVEVPEHVSYNIRLDSIDLLIIYLFWERAYNNAAIGGLS